MGQDSMTGVVVEENLERHETHTDLRAQHWKKMARKMRVSCGNEATTGLMPL